jgi:hypothetical protein
MSAQIGALPLSQLPLRGQRSRISEMRALFAPVHAIGNAPDHDVDEGVKHRQHILESQRF